MGTFDTILFPLKWVVATIMVGFHQLLSWLGMSDTSGWTWALSIVGLVIVIRIVLIPLFVKQIRASRGLQLIQPEMQKIQKKYKNKKDQASRQAMSQEMMALYKREGTNPFASCLPILLQAPIFFALFRVLNRIQEDGFSIGPLTNELREQADVSTLFGAPLSDHFLGATTTSTRVLTMVLIVLMSATTFITQKQLMQKNMPAAALDNPFAKQQKVLLYALPLIFLVSGVNFPIGVLLYWLTTNLWSMGQQFYVIRRNPAPGSPAAAALLERKAKKGQLPEADAPPEEIEPPKPAQRVQPKRQPKSQRKGGPQGGGQGSAAKGSPGKNGRPPSNGATNPGSKNSGSRPKGGAAGNRPPSGSRRPSS